MSRIFSQWGLTPCWSWDSGAGTGVTRFTPILNAKAWTAWRFHTARARFQNMYDAARRDSRAGSVPDGMISRRMFACTGQGCGRGEGGESIYFSLPAQNNARTRVVCAYACVRVCV